MRLDLFLKESKIIKRRTIAKAFCEKGLVKVNDKVAKPSLDVKTGDKVLIKFGDKEFLISAIVELVGKKERAFYEKS